MSFLLNRRGAIAFGQWALILRLFNAIALDGAALGNSGWISLLLAGIFSIPIILMLCLLTRTQPSVRSIDILDQAFSRVFRRIYCLFLLAFSLFDMATNTRTLVYVTQYVAFDQSPTLLLAGFAVLICLAACLMGGTGVSGSVQMWSYLFMGLLGIVLISELEYYNPRWLLPLLGPGLDPILNASFSYAGMITTSVATWLLMDDEQGKDRTGGVSYKPTGPWLMFRNVLIALGVSLVLVLAMSMLTPTMPKAPNGLTFRVELMLSNGFNDTSLQLPLMIAWFIPMLLTLAYYLYTSGFFIKCLFERLKYWVCLVIASALSLGLTFTSLGDRAWIDKINGMVRLPLLTIPLLVLGTVYLIRQRRNRVAAS